MTIRVLLADDERAFRDTLARLLLSSGHADVVATASNGKEAVELYRELMPEAVLMDVVMPVCDGIEATRRILAVDADAQIITLTSGDDYRALTLCLAAGARGCLKKGPDTSTLAALMLAIVVRPAVEPPAPGWEARMRAQPSCSSSAGPRRSARRPARPPSPSSRRRSWRAPR